MNSNQQKCELFVALAFVAALLSAPALAQEAQPEGQVKAKIEDLREDHNKTPGEDVDDLITNPLLRAESGSKSKYSLATSLSYNGGSLQKPLAEDRPNITGTTGTTDKALLDGAVSFKYNLSARHALLAGVGVRWIAPLSAGSPQNYNGDRLDADNPYITYQYLYKFAGIQSVFQVYSSYYTNANLAREGYLANVGVSQDNVYELGTSGVSLGLSTWFQVGFFNRSGPLGSPGDANYVADVRDDQSDYGFGISPVLEYQFNDKINFRTVSNIWAFEHIRSQRDSNTYFVDTFNQSVGIGVALTRDIFLYPNVQFIPSDMRAERTNVALSSNINLF